MSSGCNWGTNRSYALVVLDYLYKGAAGPPLWGIVLPPDHLMSKWEDFHEHLEVELRDTVGGGLS